MVLVMFVLLKTSLYRYLSLPFANGEAICGGDKKTGDVDSFSKTKSTVGSFLNSIMFSLVQDPFLFPEKKSGEYM
jgi:hypothetical protein